MTWLVTPAFAEDAKTAAPAATAAAPAATGAAEHGSTHGEVGAAEPKGPFPPFDTHTFPSQIFWFIICFGALYLLMKNLIVPRIGGIVEGRAARIAGDIGEAQRLKADSDSALTTYEKALAEARRSAQKIAQTATDEAKAAQAKQSAEIEQRLSEQLAVAESRIGEIKSKALADVGAIAEEATSAVVLALSGQSSSSDEVSGAVAAELAKTGAA